MRQDDVTRKWPAQRGRDVTRADQSAVRSPGGRGQAESPVSSRAGAGPERVSEAESKQAGDPPFPSGSGAPRSRPEPAALARLRASGGRAPAPGSRRGRGGRDGAARAARLDGRRRSRRPAPSILSLPEPAPRGPGAAVRRGAAFADAGHLDAREMPNPKNSKGGRKNKRANSSGDEQENGAGALAAAGAAGAAAGGGLAAAAGCGAAAAGVPGTGGAAGTGGAGTGAANAAAAAGAAAAGDAKNGKTGLAGRAPTSSPTGTARWRGLGRRGLCVDNARVRKCSPRLSAPRRQPLPGPHAWRGRRLRGPFLGSAPLPGRVPGVGCVSDSEGPPGARRRPCFPRALPVLAGPSVCPGPWGKGGRKELPKLKKNDPIGNLDTSSFFRVSLSPPPPVFPPE